MRALVVLAFGALALAGCAEQDQAQRGTKADTAAFNGTAKQPPFTAVGWKPGDKGNWESHLKNRTVQGQNDYVKVP